MWVTVQLSRCQSILTQKSKYILNHRACNISGTRNHTLVSRVTDNKHSSHFLLQRHSERKIIKLVLVLLRAHGSKYWGCDNSNVTYCCPTEVFLHAECNNGPTLLSGPPAVISSDYHLPPQLKGPLSSPRAQTGSTIRSLTRGQREKHKHESL